MYIGNNNTEIYIGCGAGKQLSDDILNAGSEVKIVSPYISNYLIDDLNILLNRGIKITLITSTGDYGGNLLAKNDEFYKKLIRQVRHTDETARQRREKGIRYSRMFRSIVIMLFIIAIATFLKGLIQWQYLFLPLFAFFIAQMVLSRFRKIKIYHYTYETPFKLKVFLRQDTDSSIPFIHAKIFVIDDKIAYLGSVNYTYYGFTKNYESRVRITEERAVNEISREIDFLFRRADLNCIDIQNKGKRIFPEPSN